MRCRQPETGMFLLGMCLAREEFTEYFVFAFPSFVMCWIISLLCFCFGENEGSSNTQISVFGEKICNFKRVFLLNVLIPMLHLLGAKFSFQKLQFQNEVRVCAGNINNTHGLELFPCFLILLCVDCYFLLNIMDDDAWTRMNGVEFVYDDTGSVSFWMKHGWLRVRTVELWLKTTWHPKN